MSEDNGISLNNWPNQLLSMMYVIKKYNLEMLKKNHLLTTSIACGPCDYEPRIDNLYTRKNPLIGNGYVRAFTDNEYGLPKLKAGECRILLEGFPDYPERFEGFFNNYHENNPEEAFLTHNSNLRKSSDGRHLYYYWMLNDDELLDSLIREIKYENDRLYEGLKQIYKKYSNYF